MSTLRVVPSGGDSSQEGSLKSHFKNYGILALPVILFVPLGIFGFRPSELVKGKIGYGINIYFIFNYLMILLVGVGYLVKLNNYSDTLVIFMASFAILMIVKFSFLFYAFYKKYSIFGLLRDVRIATNKNLSREELLYVILVLFVILALIGYNCSFWILIVIDVFKTGRSDNWKPQTIQTDHPVGIRIIVIIECWFYLLKTWSSVLLTSFVVFITAIVFRKEYVNCVNKAKDKIIKNHTVSNDDLSEIFQRFYDLNAVLQKADEMLSPIIGLNIIIALGVLCGASYASLIGDGSLKQWHFPILLSIMTLFILIPPLTAIHNQVMLVMISTLVIIFNWNTLYFYNNNFTSRLIT